MAVRDGTAPATYMVEDIYVFPNPDADPYGRGNSTPHEMTVMDGYLYFFANTNAFSSDLCDDQRHADRDAARQVGRLRDGLSERIDQAGNAALLHGVRGRV